ncbi:MAG: C40 family peptidase [Rhodoferax sp.]
MHRLLTVLLALWLSVPAQAAPAESPDDNMGQFLAERGLLQRIGDAGLRLEARASDLVVNAMGFLGVPYKRGGTSADTGFDCSGFVRAIYEQTVGLVLPRTADQQAASTEKINRNELQPGDLVFFNTLRRAFSHVGIYIGNGKFIHSPRAGAEVRVEDMGLSYWSKRFDGARRVSVQGAQDGASPAPNAAALQWANTLEGKQ